jgi:hypothetical protein
LAYATVVDGERATAPYRADFLVLLRHSFLITSLAARCAASA